MKNHAFIFSALFITGALFPLPEFSNDTANDSPPKPRHLEEVAYDRTTNTLFLFGGVERDGQAWIERDDFFAYNGQWLHKTEKGPIGRRGHALIYDEGEKRILLVGGVAQTRSGIDSLLFDMWTWSNNEWKILKTRCPVKEARAVYDPDKKRILLYGDANDLSKPYDGTEQRKYELWEFASGRWLKLSDNGPADGPFPVAYNRSRKTLGLLQWKDSGQLVLWEWKSKKWDQREFTSNIPVARGKYAFAYSRHHDSYFVFGGVDSKRDFLGDFWKCDGKVWTKIDLPGTPSPRASLRLVDAGDRLLLYGGATTQGITNELWQLKNNVWIKQ